MAGFFQSGRPGRITFVVSSRRVLSVELVDVMANALAIRTLVPGASGGALDG